MTSNTQNERIEALLMALLSYAHADSTELAGDKERMGKVFGILSRVGFKGSEIAQIFGVSEATVSRLKA